MTLHLYFARQYITVLLRVVLFAATLVFVFVALESLRRSGTEPSILLFALKSAAKKTPDLVSESMLIIVTVSAIWYCGRMTNSNQFVASRAAGMSALGCLTAPIACVVLVGFLGTLFLNPVIASISGKQAMSGTNSIEDVGDAVPSKSLSGIWLRQPQSDGHEVVNVRDASGTGAELGDVMVFSFDSEGRAIRTTHAETASLIQDDGGRLNLAETKTWTIDPTVPYAELSAETAHSLTFPTTITSDRVRFGNPVPEVMQVWNIPRLVRSVDRAGFSSLAYRLHFHLELARPMLLAATFIIGSAFVLGVVRRRHFGRRAFFALLSGVAMSFFLELTRFLGMAGELQVSVAAWFLPLSATMLGLSFVLFLEDG